MFDELADVVINSLIVCCYCETAKDSVGFVFFGGFGIALVGGYSV